MIKSLDCKIFLLVSEAMHGSRSGGGGGGGGQGSPLPVKNHKAKGFLSKTGPDHMRNHKATKPAFNVAPTLAPSEMMFRWRANDGLLLVLFGPSHHPSFTKKNP